MTMAKNINIKILGIVFVSLLLIFAICPKSSYALIPIVGDMGGSTEGLGNFSGTFSYNASILTISLLNTSDPSNGGFITALAFNNPLNGAVTSVALTNVTLSYTTDEVFQSLGLTNNGLNAEPFGYFDMGASLSDKFHGGGTAGDGIGVGKSGTFEFTLGGSGFNEADFVNELSQGGNRSSWFLVRFRGFIEEEPGSDKVPPEIIPEPTSLVLLGFGLFGMAGIKIKRRKLKW